MDLTFKKLFILETQISNKHTIILNCEFFFAKHFQEKKMQVFPSKTTISQLEAIQIHVDIFINTAKGHFKLKPYTVPHFRLAVLATQQVFALAANGVRE
jgi:hypothetical protein